MKFVLCKGMKNIILILLLIAPTLHAKEAVKLQAPRAIDPEDRLESMNKHARLADRKITDLVDRTENCVKYVERTRADLQGFLFVLRNGVLAMSCSYVQKPICTEAPSFDAADLQVQDLVNAKLTASSSVYQLTKKAFSESGQCAKEVAEFDALVGDIRSFGREFNKLKAIRPKVPSIPSND